MKSIPTSPDPTGWPGHVVLCGLGGAGIRIVEGLLLAGARVMVVDNGSSTPFRQALADQGVPVILGDCTLIPTLDAAGVRCIGGDRDGQQRSGELARRACRP